MDDSEPPKLLARNLAPAIRAALADTPVVMLNGPRQSGKSTLARALAEAHDEARFITLDEAAVLSAAQASPTDFIADLGGHPVVIDEVQRVPDLFLAIKAAVDRDRRPGRFLLTGSADVLLLPRVSESLAGRMEIHTLWPLSQGEIEGVREAFIDAAFTGEFPTRAGGGQLGRPALFRRILRGGFPEIQWREDPERRRAWFESYITTILQRDVRDIANIEGLTEMPALLALLAARSTALVSFAELSRSSRIPQTTLKRYLALLEMSFFYRPLPAWSGNLGKRLTRSPRVMLTDTGLQAHLLGLEEVDTGRPDPSIGPLLETFVLTELRKQLGWSRTRPRLYHFRTTTGQEVDIVLEDRRGRMVGIEVKASAGVSDRDFRHLRSLAEKLGERFHRGIVLYTGAEPLGFGRHLMALPIPFLWRIAANETG